MNDDMKDDLVGVITFIIVLLLFFAFIFGACKISEKRDAKRWNDGYCDVCGGTWKYEQAVGHRSYTSYIYVCDNCGKRIEISKIR